MPAQPWTLDRILTKVKDDLDLHSEDNISTDQMIQFVEDAITDHEEIVIDAFSDFLLTYIDLEATAGAVYLDLPVDIYESRIRRFRWAKQGFDNPSGPGDTYKITKMDLDDDTSMTSNVPYSYRLINDGAFGQRLKIQPPILETTDYQFRLWYIRQFKRLTDMADVLEKGLRPQFIISHVKCACMKEEGDVMLDVEAANLLRQEDKIKNSLSRLTDDDEDTLLMPDNFALDEAYDCGEY